MFEVGLPQGAAAGGGQGLGEEAGCRARKRCKAVGALLRPHIGYERVSQQSTVPREHPLPHRALREPGSRSRRTCPAQRRLTPVHSHWQDCSLVVRPVGSRRRRDRGGAAAAPTPPTPRPGTAARSRRWRRCGHPTSKPAGHRSAAAAAGLVDLVVERQRVGFVEHPAHHPVRAAGRRSARVSCADPRRTPVGCSALMTNTSDGRLQSAAMLRAVRTPPHCSGRLTRPKPRRRGRGARTSSTHGLVTTAGLGRP
jgi:hypothetical protein